MPQVEFWELMLAVIVPAMVWASWNDLRHQKVPNWLNAALALSGISAQAAYGGWSGLGNALMGMGVGFGLLIVLWAIHGMGAGDVKFMAAIGAWVGPQLAFSAVLVGGIVGGIIAVGMILYHRTWREASTNLGVLLIKVSTIKTAFSEFGSAKSMSYSTAVLPYAVPLSLGTLFVLVSDYFGWWEVL